MGEAKVRDVRDEVKFLLAGKHYVYYKLVASLWASKSPTR